MTVVSLLDLSIYSTTLRMQCILGDDAIVAIELYNYLRDYFPPSAASRQLVIRYTNHYYIGLSAVVCTARCREDYLQHIPECNKFHESIEGNIVP